MDILGRGSLPAAIPELDLRIVRGRGAQALVETGVGGCLKTLSLGVQAGIFSHRLKSWG